MAAHPNRLARTLRTLCVLLLLAGVARGEPFGTTVVRASRPDEADDVGTTTRIYLDEPRAQTGSVADVLAGEAGVRVRSRGGVGAFSSVSIRGSEAAEVAVLLDGVPISRAGFGLLDLSQFPTEGLERIEIYRGAAPLAFGSESIGGVINLVSKRALQRPIRSITGGGGSFGARLVGASLGQPIGAWRALVTATYRGATGDFSFYDNGGTLFLRDDDRERTRRNNGFDQVALSATLGHQGRFDTQIALHGLWRKAGVPGFATLGTETRHAALETSRLLLTARTQGLLPRQVRLQLLPSFEAERLAFENPGGELVGPFGPAVQESVVVAGGVQLRAERRFGRWQLGSILAEVRGEGRWARNLLAPARSSPHAARVAWGVGLVDQVTLGGDRLLLEGALRVDGIGSFVATRQEHRLFASPRLGLRGRPHPRVTLRASGGRFVRTPTLLELFGDGGLFLGAPNLKSESAWGGELGAHVEGTAARAMVKGLVDLAGFGRHVTDLIAYVPGQNASTAINLGAATLFGAEVRGTLELATALRLRLDYTLLDARNRGDEPGVRGKRLPGRATHEARGTIELTAYGVHLGYTAHYVGRAFRDERNLNALPDYVLHELQLGYRSGLITLSIDLQNLADLRVRPLPLGGSALTGQTTPYPLVDLFNYPLPGRAVYASLTVHP